jgi:hypothetical protein
VDAVAVGGMDMCRKVLERDGVGPGEAPQVEGALVHCKPVVRQVPGPQGDAGLVHREAEMVGAPDLKRGVSCEHAAPP